MLCNVNFRKIVLIGGFLFVFIRPTAAYAWGDDHHDRFDRHDHYYRDHGPRQFGMRIDLISNDYVPVVVDGARYYYYDGLYYVFTGNAYVLVAPPVGAIVPVISPVFHPVIINGVTYYTDNVVYYVYTRNGYQVVPPPVVQVIPEPVVFTPAARVVPEYQNQTKVAEGVRLGGILGAIAGGIIGHQMKGHHELGGALIGGVAGAATGGIVGAQIPNQDASAPAAAVQPAPVAVTPPPAVAVVPAVAQEASRSAVATAPAVADESFTINIPNRQSGYTTVIIKRSGIGFVGPQGEYYSEFPKVSQLQAMYSK